MLLGLQTIKTRSAALFIAAALIFTQAAAVSSVFIAHADSGNSYTTLSAFSGHPGATVTVSGGGYAANETVAVSAVENGSTIASATTKATAGGDYNTTIVLPTKLAQGSATITATGVTSGLVSSNAYYVSPFSPTITSSASDTVPYGTLAVTGTGFAPNEAIVLNLAGAATAAKADAKGNLVSTTVTTPNVPAASYKLVAAGQDSGATATNYIYINGFYASASPTSYYVLPNTPLGFNGSGFAPNETITVTDGTSGATVSSFKADAQGAFTNGGAFNVPASYAGLSKNFVLLGSLSNASPIASVTIGQYFPNVSPSTYYVMPGKTVSFNGSGFIAGETVNVYSGTTLLTTVTADTKGNLVAAGSVTIPNDAAGTVQSYKLIGQTSMGSGSVSVQIGSYNPQASPSTYFAMPGSIITFSGTDYAPSEVVAVFSGLNQIGSITTDATGAFTAQGSVQLGYDQANTSVNYSLVGATSKSPIAFTIGVGQLQTLLSPSNYYVLPFESFSADATGFAIGETVTLTNGTTVLGTAVVNAKGTASFTKISLPAGASSATLIATGTTSKATTSATVGIGAYNATVTADNYYAQPGSTLNLTGTGFAPNEPVTIAAAGKTTTATVDAKGNLTASLVLPFTAPKNAIDIVSTGSLSGAVSTTSITLAPFNIQVSPSTYYAQPGTKVSFTGSGFIVGEAVNISLNGKQIGTETIDAKGNLASKGYTLPFAKSADFTLTGVTSGATSTYSIGLAQFYAGLQLSGYYGNGGSVINAIGSGFAPNEIVNVAIAGKTVAIAAADAKGAFTKAVAVPYMAPGTATYKATGVTSGATASTGYTVAQVYNSVELAKYGVPAGKAVTFIGSGYLANEPVKVTNDRDSSSYNLKANATGAFNDSGYILPTTLKEGMMSLTITGTYSYTVHTITFYVQDVNAATN